MSKKSEAKYEKAEKEFRKEREYKKSEVSPTEQKLIDATEKVKKEGING